MTKFVASVIAGIIATVVGGLILSHLINSRDQQATPRAASPSPDATTYFATYAEAEGVCGKDRVWQVDSGSLAGRYFCY